MTGARVFPRAVAVVGALAALAAPSAARAAFTWDFALGARVMTTDNLHLDPEPQQTGQRAPVRETVYAAVPVLTFAWEQGPDHIAFGTRGEYWTFTGDEELEAQWLPDLSGALAWRRWAPFFLEADVSRDRVPTTQDRDGQTILDQADRTAGTVRTGLAWEGVTRRVEVAYHGGVEYFSGGRQGAEDRVVRQAAEVLVRRQWDPRLGSEARGLYGVVDQRLAADYTQMRASVSADYRISERLTARGGLEWLRDDHDAFSGQDGGGETAARHTTSLLKSAEIRRSLERDGFWALSYGDELQSQPNGDTLERGRVAADGLLRARLGSGIGAGIWRENRHFRVSGRDETDWGPRALARWVIAQSLAFDVGGSWTRASIQETGVPEITDRTLRCAAALLVVLGRHVTAEAGYSYRHNASTDVGRAYTANTFYAGVTYHVTLIQPGALPASQAERLSTSDQSLVGGR